MAKRLNALTVLVVCLLNLSGWARADGSCEQATRKLDYSKFLGINGQCTEHKEEFCNQLANLDPEEFERLAAKPKGESGNARRHPGKMTVPEAFAACGLDFDTIHYRHCEKAYRQENLDFVSNYCPGEAWSLARAQCERSPETVSSRYVRFCNLFYTGKAPGSGERSPGD
jgi:hypothetical protein